MTGLLLVVAIVAGGAGLAIGLPAWRSWETRVAADRNAERYLAWRGRGDRSASGSGPPMTIAERRRMLIGVGLGGVAIGCLIIGLWSG